MKRKASYLDGENEMSPWISRSPLSDSSVGSLTSPDRASIKSMSRVIYPNSSTAHIGGLNPRTRKRYRDNRPDSNMIHQHTLAKLYNAQKVDQSARSDSEKPLGPFQSNTVSQREDTQPASAQRSLHSFFNIRQPQPTTISPVLSHQHPDSVPELCSDCGNHLSDSPGDRDVMEIDHSSGIHMIEDYECAVCQRQVCNTCAVRGDQRICLECALPGRG